jgi:hypothetical protein
MKKEFYPYYISRAVLSAVFTLVMVGFNWIAIPIALAFLGLFVLYLHSGWFGVNPESPLFPLRRDTRGQLIQRRALLISVTAGLLTYIVLSCLLVQLPLSSDSGHIALGIGVIAYFISQFTFLSRT